MISKKQTKSREGKTKKRRKNDVKSVQNTLPYINEYNDGILEVGKGVFSKTIRFSDINYSTARKEEQEKLFFRYCELLNSYSPQVGIQITINNKSINKNDFEKAVFVEKREDALDLYRTEYNVVLKGKIDEGRSNIIKEKYITLTYKAANYEVAKDYFTRLESETLGLLKKNGSIGQPLELPQRMEVFHDIYRNGHEGEFSMDRVAVNKRHGLSSKDSIAPMSIEIKTDHVMIGEKYAQVLFLKDYPTFLNDGIISELTGFRFNMLMSIRLNPIAPDKAHKLVMRHITAMESDKMALENKAQNKNKVTPFIPYKLRTALAEAQELLEDIVNRDQKLFMTTITIMHMADTRNTLNQQFEMLSQAAAKNLFQLDKLLLQQEEGMNIVLPYGLDGLKLDRTLTTEVVGGFIPFDTYEMFHRGGIYYGQNAITHNIIAINRKKLKTPSGFVLGTPGSGKSFKEKEELIALLLGTDDDVIIIDPEREYTEIVRNFGGEVIHISASSQNYINPLDLTETYSDDENGSHDPLLVKSDFILSLFDVLIGGKTGLTPTDISIIDRCARLAYQPLFENEFNLKYMPTLETLYDIIKEQPEPEAANIISALELYVHGTLNVFSNKTNVNVHNRLVCYDTKDLGKNLKTAGMLIVMDAVWNKITANREAGKRTWLPIDEIQVFFSNALLEAFFDEVWRRFRKWGGIPTGITQNVTPLLKSTTATNMLQNSEFVVMMNQAPQDRDKLAEMFNISESLMSYITDAEEGSGLIRAGGNIVPFVDVFPKDTKLYRMMTTKIEELHTQSEKKKYTL